MGPYKAIRTKVDEFIPYYMEKMGVDRPYRTYGKLLLMVEIPFPTTWDV